MRNAASTDCATLRVLVTSLHVEPGVQRRSASAYHHAGSPVAIFHNQDGGSSLSGLKNAFYQVDVWWVHIHDRTAILAGRTPPDEELMYVIRDGKVPSTTNPGLRSVVDDKTQNEEDFAGKNRNEMSKLA
ncbi:hypothetical protein PCANC_08506 [Puccinia coronata f. sp. avenae]|uniref:Uncharacterized protein n=1 Tax=Puccinia coronata f. sp. avenae TaxID=200324 RepID=A0A2N5V9B0_9BASI|nr:hypothetical protein PCANC_08506 [Puccinia coronata f. sp. avenae]